MKLFGYILTTTLALCHQGNVGLLGTDVTVSGILHHPLVEVPDQTSLSETEDHRNITADVEDYYLFTELAVSLPPELTGVGRSHLMKIVYNVIGIAGAPANLMVIFIVLKSRRMRDKPFNLLVLHQSFIDFLVCLSMVLNQYYSSLDDVGGPDSSIADLYCRLWISPMTQWTLISCSGNNLVVMTIERYLAITVPLRYDKHKVKKRLPYTFLFIWLLSIVIMSPDIIMSSVSHGQCGVHVFDDKNTGIGIFSFWILTFLIIPTTVMFFSYAHMIIVISKSRFTELNESEKGNMDLSASTKRTETMKKVQMNVIQTCVIVCMFFVFTMSFSFITDALVIFGWVQDFSSNIWTAAVIAVVLNSCINPFIYTIRYKEFQTELLRLLWISRLCGEQPSNNSMTSNAPTLKKPSNSPPSVY